MACRLFGVKPLPEPMLTYCQWDPLEQTSVKFESRYKTFLSKNCILRRRHRNGAHFFPRGGELIDTMKVNPMRASLFNNDDEDYDNDDIS